MRDILDKKSRSRSRKPKKSKQIEGSVGSVPQVSPRIVLERLLALPQTSSLQHGCHADIDFCKWNVDTNVETRENDQDSATKDDSLYRTDEKEMQIKKSQYEQERMEPEMTKRQRK